jgi:hypothetical protein
LWRGQVSAVTALGLPGQELPSDRVTGLQTDHPDEAPGNTVVNHSFSVTFVKAKATAGGDVNTPIPAASAISGRVRSGTGRTVQLIRDAAEASAAGTAGCAIASDESYHFSGLAAGAYRVVVAGTPIVSDTLTLDGTNTLIADLVVPTAGKPLAHYVLFGPAAHPTTKAHLLLAQDYLLAFGPSFGFSAIEATVADLVTIVGGTDATSAESEAALVASGATVQRIAGTPAEVAAALTRRITAGRPF